MYGKKSERKYSKMLAVIISDVAHLYFLWFLKSPYITI